MGEVRQYPIDYDNVTKGTVIPVEEVERLVDAKAGTEKFALASLGLRQRIEQDLEGLGRPMMVAQRHHAIEMLDDEEAASYGAQLFNRCMRGMMRHHRRNGVAVAIQELSPKSRSEHERNMEINGKTLQGMISSRREAIKALPHKRQTPGLPEPE